LIQNGASAALKHGIFSIRFEASIRLTTGPKSHPAWRHGLEPNEQLQLAARRNGLVRQTHEQRRRSI